MRLEVGDFAPDFSLIGSDGLIYALNQYKGYRAIVIFFSKDECPYAKGIEEHVKDLVREFHKKGVAFLGIHPGEDPIHRDLPWRSLGDPTQAIAKRYGALVTPHFFMFDSHRMLIYSGRALDETREHLKEALSELLDLRPITLSETDPVGTPIQEEVLV